MGGCSPCVSCSPNTCGPCRPGYPCVLHMACTPSCASTPAQVTWHAYLYIYTAEHTTPPEPRTPLFRIRLGEPITSCGGTFRRDTGNRFLKRRLCDRLI